MTTQSKELREAIADIQAQHWLQNNSQNLGQYKSKYTCNCGKKLIEDGHANDWHSSIGLILYYHIADELLALFNKAVHDKVVEIVPERRDSARSCGDNFDHGFVACRNQILQAVEEG